MRLPVSLMALTLSFSVHAQIPNPGFEEWALQSIPDGWLGSINVSSTSDAHSGALAALGTVVINGGDLLGTQVGCDVDVTEEPTELRGWFKYNPTAGSSEFYVGVVGFDADQFINGAGGSVIITTEQSEYAEFIVPISAPTGDPTASIYISIGISTLDPAAVGSTFHIDDVVLNSSTDVSEIAINPTSLDVGRAYPSPFSTSTKASFRMGAADRVVAEIVDALGRPLETLLDGNLPSGTHQFEWTPGPSYQSGLYFMRIRSGSSTFTRAVLLER
jgi:hypothetical protein